MRIVFFGTPSFSAQVLDYLLQQQVNIVAVISKPDRPKGRSATPVATPVKATLLATHPIIPVYQPEIVSDLAFADVLKAYEADLFVVVAYGEIIKQHLLDMPRKGCINLHVSLLPKYRGAAPIQHSIIAGEAQTGITIMHMVRKMDAGDIIKQIPITIGPEKTFGELESSIIETGKQALLEVIHEFDSGEPVRYPQDHTQATLAPKIELEDCEIKWTRGAQELHDLIRGVNPYPGAWCYVKVKGEIKRLKISRSRVIASSCLEPGKVLNRDQKKENMIISTGSQALELVEVQLEGKRSMPSEELTRGIARDNFEFNF